MTECLKNAARASTDDAGNVRAAAQAILAGGLGALGRAEATPLEYGPKAFAAIRGGQAETPRVILRTG